MAYFACGTAALTGTDQATRVSIAKGLVSPTFTNPYGKTILRGVLQADVVTGRDTGYATGQTIAGRLAAAARGVAQGTSVSANQARRSVSSSPQSTTAPAQLYAGDKGVIKSSTVLGLSKKMLIGVIAGIVVIGAVVMRR